MKKAKLICIEGLMGAGKTTFTSNLQSLLGEKATFIYEEFAENPHIEEFYELKQEGKPIPSKLALELEMWFVNQRAPQLRKALESGKTVISDWWWRKCEFFAKNTIEDDVTFATFKAKLHEITQHFPKPDIVLYLNCSVNESKKRMVQRGRSYEKAVPTTYLERLNDAYLSALHGQNHLVINNARTNWPSWSNFLIEPLLID